MDGCSRQGGQERLVLRERVRGVLLEKATALEHPHHALGGGFGDSRNVYVCQGRCWRKDRGATGTFDKSTVGHQDVEVRVDVEGRAEAPHECDRAEARVIVALPDDDTYGCISEIWPPERHAAYGEFDSK